MATIEAAAESREEFLLQRREALGATDLAAILGLSKWATPWQIWAEKTGRLEPFSGNRATAAGVALEPAILSYAESQLGKLTRNVRVSTNNAPIVATCDAVVAGSLRPVEAKTTGIVGPIYGEWGAELSDEIPEEYLVQVHAQIICTQTDLGHLFGLIPGRGIVEFHITAHDKLHDHLKTKANQWWDRHVVRGIEPPLDPLPDLDVVKRLRREPAKSVEVAADVAELWKQRNAAKRDEKEAKGRVKEAETKILLALGDAEHASISGRDEEFTYLEIHRKGYTVEPCTYRQLRLKKGKK